MRLYHRPTAVPRCHEPARHPVDRETDAELAQLDGDGRADLIQLSASRIRVSLKREGRFGIVFERRIDGGVALAVGDAATVWTSTCCARS